MTDHWLVEQWLPLKPLRPEIPQQHTHTCTHMNNTTVLRQGEIRFQMQQSCSAGFPLWCKWVFDIWWLCRLGLVSQTSWCRRFYLKPNCFVSSSYFGVKPLVIHVVFTRGLFQLCCRHVSIFNFTDLLCVSVIACLPSPNQLATINLKDFFLFHCKRARLICQSLTQSRVNTYSTQPCQHCLWPSGEIINQPKSLPAFLLSPLSHSTFLHRFSFSHSSIFEKTPTFSHFVFLLFGNAQPLPISHSLADTRMHTKTHMYTLFIFHKVTSHIPLPQRHSPYAVIVTWLCMAVSVHCMCSVMQMWVCDHCLCLSVQVTGLGFLL